jgi:hypothetical protein
MADILAIVCFSGMAGIIGFGYGYYHALDRQRYEPPETKEVRELERIYHLEGK